MDLNIFKCNDAGDELEADFASGHGIAQFGLVVDEGHDPQVGLDEQWPLQQQHPVRPAWDGKLLMCSLYRLDQLSLKVLQLMNETGRSLQPAGELSRQGVCTVCLHLYTFTFTR